MTGRRRLLTLILLLTPLFALISLLLSASSTGNGPDAEHQVLEKMALLSEQIDHLRLLDREKNKAFRDLREQLLILIQSANEKGAVLPTLRNNLPQNNSSLSMGNFSRLLPQLPAAARASIILNLSTAQLDLGIPSIYDFLPHIVNNLDALTPAVRISAGNRRHLHTVVGIPTVRRPKTSYLLSTLRSFFDNLEESEQSEVMVVVMLASEQGLDDWASEQILALQAEFPEQIASGLLEVLVPPPAFFPPDLDAIPPTFDDSAERMKWRTKQNLDYAYLMMYAQNRGHYYLQLEDDVITKPGFFAAIKGFIAKQAGVQWLLLEFSSLGFIGKLFRSSDMPTLINFILMFHREKPVDWLLDHLFYVRFCSPEKAPKICQQVKNKYRIRYKPSLFQHVGVQSSLKGKVQKLKEKDFGKSLMHRPHMDNPPANVSTSLKVYQKYTLEAAYSGDNFFWGLLPQAGDWIRFDLNPPTELASISFRSGNAEHPDDRAYNASVEVRYLGAAEPWSRVGFFGSTGTASFHLPVPLRRVANVRILMEAESESWLILSEIWLKTPSAR